MPNTIKGVDRPVREKLIDLIEQGYNKYFNPNCGGDFFAVVADNLIANGVTVGKPLAQFLYPIDNYEGLKGKYLVFKQDTGELVENCFVLRPGKDTAAVEALRAYAHATDNKTLANGIYNWVGEGVPVQEWIPVTERLPCGYIVVDPSTNYKELEEYLVFCKGALFPTTAYFVDDKFVSLCETGCPSGERWCGIGEVTHWMSLSALPTPPKGE